MEIFIKKGDSIVTEYNNEVEALVSSNYGKIQYLGNELNYSNIGEVITGLTVRNKGLGGQLTAVKIAQEAASGIHVTGLGMFEHGFYNKLGFGTASGNKVYSFSPSALKIDKKSFRIPIRLTKKRF